MRQLISFVAIGFFAAAPLMAQRGTAVAAPAAGAIYPSDPAPQTAPPVAQGRGGVGGGGASGGGRGGAGMAPNVASARRVPTQNVRIDVTITDSFGSSPTKKTVSMLVADGRSGQIRASMSMQPQAANMATVSLALNVDAAPEVMPDGRIYVSVSVQYTPDAAYQQASAAPKPASLNESLSVLLTDGKPTMVSQSTDPQGDRKVTLEFSASVIK